MNGLYLAQSSTNYFYLLLYIGQLKSEKKANLISDGNSICRNSLARIGDVDLTRKRKRKMLNYAILRAVLEWKEALHSSK